MDADVNTTTTRSTTSTTITPAVNTAFCSIFFEDCRNCWVAGCRYCEVGPELSYEAFLAAKAQHDHSCIGLAQDCGSLTVSRANTNFALDVPLDECPGSTTTVTTTTTLTVPVPLPTLAPAEVEDTAGGEWSGNPGDWGSTQWLVLCVPIIVVLLATCCVCCTHRWRRRARLRRVYMEPRRCSEDSGADEWDLANAGRRTSLEALQKILVQLRQAKAAAGTAEAVALRGCHVRLGGAEELGTGHLELATALLDRNPQARLSFDSDWRRADDALLQALAGVLRRRGRSEFRAAAAAAGGSESGAREVTPLRLPLHPAPLALEELAEALATAAHGEVDELEFAAPPRVASVARSGRRAVSLAPLRLGCQELVLERSPAGDVGAVAVCAFVRPWSGRLHTVKMVECEIGDQGAGAISRLVGPKAAGGTLRELILSSNGIGDAGVTELAAALPLCDSLQRLLLDCNRIGPDGAGALAQHLLHSSVQELMLGSALGGNPLGDVGVQALARALDDELPRAAANRATRLTAVNLECCGLGDVGARALALGLHKSVVMALSLARNKIHDEGAQVVMKGLPVTLVSLDFSGNMLTDSSATVVADGLRRLPQLAVSLANNRLSPSLRTSLQEEHGRRVRL